MQKGWKLCQEAMVQGRLAKGQAQDVAWDEARAKVEAEWEDRLQQGRAEIVCAQAVEQRLLILQDSRVMQRVVPSVERK